VRHQARVHRDQDDQQLAPRIHPGTPVEGARAKPGVRMTPVAATAPKQSKTKTATTARPGAFAGNFLRVDLTRRKCWAEPWGPDRMRAELGVVGLGAM